LGCRPHSDKVSFSFSIHMVPQLNESRELAYQLTEQFLAVGRPLGLTTITVVGGMDMMTQAKELEARPHIVVATPGRLCDLLRSEGGNLLSRVKVLVSYFVTRMEIELISSRYSMRRIGCSPLPSLLSWGTSFNKCRRIGRPASLRPRSANRYCNLRTRLPNLERRNRSCIE
jgi:hypothetical protein